MKKSIVPHVILIITLFSNYLSLGQVGHPPGPCIFTETETFCFTNNSDKLDGGNTFPPAACNYLVCVKIKPKQTCEINCEMALDPDGYFVQQCCTLEVGNTFCFSVPAFSHPITDCFDVIITLKVLGNTPTLIADFERDFNNITQETMYRDHCLEAETWWTVLQRVGTGSGTYNFNIHTRGLL